MQVPPGSCIDQSSVKSVEIQWSMPPWLRHTTYPAAIICSSIAWMLQANHTPYLTQSKCITTKFIYLGPRTDRGNGISKDPCRTLHLPAKGLHDCVRTARRWRQDSEGKVLLLLGLFDILIDLLHIPIDVKFALAAIIVHVANLAEHLPLSPTLHQAHIF